MKKLFENLMNIISVPIILTNLFGGIIAFVWLIIEAEWDLIIFGLAGLFTSAFVLGFAFLPSAAISFIGITFYEKKIKLLAYPLFLVSAFLNICILVIWTYLVYTYALVTADTSTPKIAVTLWAYGVTVGPIQFMASKGSAENIGSFILTFFLSAGCLCLTLFIGFGSGTYGVIAYLSSMIICLIVMLFYLLEYNKIK